MKRPYLILALLSASCTVPEKTHRDTLPPRPEPVPEVILIEPRAQAVPVLPLVRAETPAEILQQSAKLRKDATDYVIWHKSIAANIDRFTILTRRAASAEDALKASLHHGRYGAVETVAAGRAKDALQFFLTAKGD